ncbi:MAG: imidazoleglycerol-phosphate dehydratase [candidate division Zixibacteria bacterium]|nr:imidazoleglycerol-phosphate dehydratase [candidate division Zixibacteria bacterium]
MTTRSSTLTRETRETQITATLELDKAGEATVATGLPFLDHMLEAWACHGGFGLRLQANGDLDVDPHHLVEDCGIVLGRVIAGSLAESGAIRRAGFYSFPMDGSLANVAIDLCGRPNLIWNVPLIGRRLGDLDPFLLKDFFKALSDNLRATVHVNVPYGDNDHHMLEAVFKAFGRGLRQAVQPVNGDVISTKGIIDG